MAAYLHFAFDLSEGDGVFDFVVVVGVQPA